MNDDDKKTKKFFKTIFSFVGIIFVIAVIHTAVSEFFEKRSDAKEYCAKEHDVLNAKTDYAAKKAYKACISNY
jgi:hypothetical protein|tara:strand:+ start:126 stop:344 length:219 start_codon:yes stop_codon:yes gene_type:complete